MRARRSAHVAFMVSFDRDSSYVVHGCWFASKGDDMKSFDFNEIMEFIWFSYDFSKSARACLFLKSLGAKTLGFYMFSLRAILKSLGNWWFWKDFDMRARRSAHDDFVVFAVSYTHLTLPTNREV